MRTRSAVLSIAALTTGLTAAVTLHRRAGRRLTVTGTPAAGTTAGTTAVPTAESAPVAVRVVVPDRDAVVLPFVRSVPAAPVEEPSTVPARCGDSGGRTKAGSPCAARATTAGRCHHHRLAA